jgi:hypothetical protein
MSALDRKRVSPRHLAAVNRQLAGYSVTDDVTDLYADLYN